MGGPNPTSGPSILKQFVLEPWDKGLPHAGGQPGMLEGKVLWQEPDPSSAGSISLLVPEVGCGAGVG